jgi:hypothetical protein
LRGNELTAPGEWPLAELVGEHVARAPTACGIFRMATAWPLRRSGLECRSDGEIVIGDRYAVGAAALIRHRPPE